MKDQVAALLVLLFASSCAIPEPRFEIDLRNSSIPTRRALLRGEIKEALAFYEAEAQEAERNAATSWFPRRYWEVATVAYREASSAARMTAQLQKSITYAEKALAIAEKTKDPVHRARAILELVNAHNSVRNFDKARELIERGLGIAKESKINWWVGTFYSLSGRDFVRRQEYKEAIDVFSKSLYLAEGELRETPGSRRNLLLTHRTGVISRLRELGDAHRLAGELPQAHEQYQRAFASIKEWGLKYAYEDSLYWSMGELYLQQKDFRQALENFQKLLALAESRRTPDGVRRATGRIGDILRQTGKPAEALPYYQKAIQQIESTRSLLQSEEYRQSYFEGGLGAYVNMTQALLESGKHEEAFNYSERARSRVFLDVLGSRVQLSRIKSGLLKEERALQEWIAALRARLSGEEDGETDRTGLRKELADAEKAYNDFLAKVRKQDKEQASLMTVQPLTLRGVQELLDPGTTLIEYFVTDREILVWVVEKEKLQFQRLPLPKGDLAKLVKTLRETVFALGEREKFNEASTSLYRHLIQPGLTHITGKELIIVPHDVLHYLPFHALVSPKGRYLIEDFPIYYLSSASLLQFTKEKRKATGEKVLAFGNPDLGDPQMNLRFAELEAKEIQGLYPQSTVLLKKEATEEKSKALSPQHDILHFASHAELSEEDPLSSAILLAKEGKEDGRLEVREIFGLDLKANLVVLSACETGLGKLSSGDELVGLTRAFIYAGTPSVVASLWKVEDSSTAALMASFYKNLRTMTKAEALRQAQLELIRGDVRSDLLARRGIGGIGKLGETPAEKPQLADSVSVPVSISTSHPYFWAPFILVGDGK